MWQYGPEFRRGEEPPVPSSPQFQDPVVIGKKAGPVPDADVGRSRSMELPVELGLVGHIEGACRLVEDGVTRSGK